MDFTDTAPKKLLLLPEQYLNTWILLVLKLGGSNLSLWQGMFQVRNVVNSKEDQPLL